MYIYYVVITRKGKGTKNTIISLSFYNQQTQPTQHK